jgi:dihydrofolate synthase/folylpolyglutamate synthase
VRLDCPVVTVTGTNGKGSTCAMLEAILRCAGYRTGLYTSPHLLRYNERVRIGGEPQDDASLLAAFHAVEDARGDVALTYFEYGTLARCTRFARAGLDAAILEVGLGGPPRCRQHLRCRRRRRDDASISITWITSVRPRADIAREKAGIFRARAAGGMRGARSPRDPDRPRARHRRAVAADRSRLRLCRSATGSGVIGAPAAIATACPIPRCAARTSLRMPRRRSRSSVSLQDRLHVGAGAIRDGLCAVSLPGRFQVLPGRPAIVLDVAHNPHAARVLAATLGAMGYFPETIAVLGMLATRTFAA